MSLMALRFTAVAKAQSAECPQTLIVTEVQGVFNVWPQSAAN